MAAKRAEPDERIAIGGVDIGYGQQGLRCLHHVFAHSVTGARAWSECDWRHWAQAWLVRERSRPK